MNTGQMLITLAAMMLLSLVILRVTNTFLHTESSLLDSKFGVLGISLATSMMEEATGKAFDENSTNGTIPTLANLSVIGPDLGEKYADFDDFDDYDGLVKIDTTMPVATYKVECKISYVNPADLDKSSIINTWHKKLDVMVTTPASDDTVHLSTVYSYFYFR
ncbi:MAG: hypothetical protein ABFS12_01165 [Bacteroidota bacterium]